MSLKSLSIFLAIIAFCLTIESAIYRDYATVGEEYQFDFGNDIKSLFIIRDGSEKELVSADNTTSSNIKFTKDGILIISPVTENDFGIYQGVVEIEDEMESESVESDVGPPTLYLSRNEL